MGEQAESIDAAAADDDASDQFQLCPEVRFDMGEQRSSRAVTFSQPAASSNAQCAQMLIELFELDSYEAPKAGWQQTTRWLAYEQVLEGHDHKHWSRPHIPLVRMQAVTQLRKYFTLGGGDDLFLDIPGSFLTVRDAFDLVMEQRIDAADQQVVHSVLYRFVTPIVRTRATTNKSQQHFLTVPGADNAPNGFSVDDLEFSAAKNRAASYKAGHGGRRSFTELLRRVVTQPDMNASQPALEKCQSHNMQDLQHSLDDDAQAAQILTGELQGLSRAYCIFLRFNPAVTLWDYSLRLLIIMLSPPLEDTDVNEAGRALGALLANQVVKTECLSATCVSDLLKATDALLQRSLLMPICDLSAATADNLLTVKHAAKILQHGREQDETRRESREHRDSLVRAISNKYRAANEEERRAPLERTGRWFGGVLDDARDRFPLYLSDVTDAWHTKCLTSTAFMFCACFAPALTFGGLMSEYTGQQLGICETLMSQSVCGIVWALASAQPIMIQAATGPVLIFEGALYKVCEALSLPFLTVRLWTSLYVLLFALLTTAFEATYVLKYITRFTEDIFSTLISIIFIKEALKFLFVTVMEQPLLSLTDYTAHQQHCYSQADNITTFLWQVIDASNGSSVDQQQQQAADAYIHPCARSYQPNTALWTAVLMALTLALAFTLRRVRASVYFGRTMRELIGDFGVFISIVAVSCLDGVVYPDVYVKIPWHMPTWYGYLIPVVPAFLLYILLFVETEITELLLLKRSHGLRKGSGGHHWDLLLCAVLTVLAGLFGVPWMCAAAVQSVAHRRSLTLYTRHAPGEADSVERVVEQRITTLVTAVGVGACAFAGEWLAALPVAVLFGVFVYLAVCNLAGVQLVRHTAWLAIPEKHLPDDNPICEQISLLRIHVYTGIQLAGLAAVLVVKEIKSVAVAFPLVLLLLAAVRELLLPKFYSHHELALLDSHDGAPKTDDDYFDMLEVYE